MLECKSQNLQIGSMTFDKTGQLKVLLSLNQNYENM